MWIFFGLSENSGLVYTPRRLHLLISYKLNLFGRHKQKYPNLKEVYAFEFRKESSVSYIKQNLTQS